MRDENIERHCVKLWTSADTVFVLTQFQRDRQKDVFSARKQCQKDNMSCKRVVYLNVFMSIDVDDMSRRHRHRHGDMATTTRRRRHVVAAQKHENWMPKYHHLAHTCSSHERFSMPSAAATCRVVTDVDMATTTHRRGHVAVVSKRRHVAQTLVKKRRLCSQKSR